MSKKVLMAIIAFGSLAAVTAHAEAAEPGSPNQRLQLSPDVLDLLRAEMRELAGGVQGIALSLATGDWKSIEETSATIRASYIMEKKLIPAQAKELEQALPEDFKRLDTEFHQRAARLGAAAATHDAELVAFEYSRLLATCALCHSAYASSRFPGFSSPARQSGHH